MKFEEIYFSKLDGEVMGDLTWKSFFGGRNRETGGRFFPQLEKLGAWAIKLWVLLGLKGRERCLVVEVTERSTGIRREKLGAIATSSSMALRVGWRWDGGGGWRCCFRGPAGGRGPTKSKKARHLA